MNNIGFENSFKSSLENLFTKCKSIKSDKPLDSVDELEFRFGKKESKFFNSKNDITSFQKMINYMRENYPNVENINNEKQILMLNIRIQNYENSKVNDLRISVNGKKDFENYCNKNYLDELDNVSYEIKKRISNVEMNGFSSVRLSASTEKELIIPDNNTINGVSMAELNHILRSKLYQKLYRIKKRYSFKVILDPNSESAVKVDLTAVRQAKGYSLRDSNVRETDEEYEIEVEFLGNINLNNYNAVINNENLIKFMKNFTCCYNDVINPDYLIDDSTKNQVLTSYLNMYYRDNWSREIVEKNAKRFFIGTDVLPIEEHHLINSVEGNNKIINEKYHVSVKADGERMIMFIKGDDNNVYLINNRLSVIVVGTLNKNIEKGNYYVIDGELIEDHNMKNKFFVCIDILYSNDTDTRRKNFTERKELTHQFVNTIKINGIKVNMITYKEMSNKESFSSFLKEIANTIFYETDGFIFTPNCEYPNNIKNKKCIRLKWKPVDKQSIDFKLKFNKISKNNFQYKKVNNQKKLVATLTYVMTVNGKTSFPTFTVGNYPDASFIYLDMNEDDKPVFDNKILKDGTIAECIFSEGQWKMIKVRYDKKFPNGKVTVLSNWNLIVNPIEEEMLKNGKTQEEPPKEIAELPKIKTQPKKLPEQAVVTEKPVPKPRKKKIEKPVPKPRIEKLQVEQLEKIDDPVPSTDPVPSADPVPSDTPVAASSTSSTPITTPVPTPPPRKPSAKPTVVLKKPVEKIVPEKEDKQPVPENPVEKPVNNEYDEDKIKSELLSLMTADDKKNKFTFTRARNRLTKANLYSLEFVNNNKKNIEIIVNKINEERAK